MVKTSALGVLLSIPFMLAMLCFTFCMIKTSLADWIQSKAFFVVAQLVSLCLMTYIAYEVMPELRWDWGVLIKGASSIVLGDGLGDNPYYLIRYPHNRFWFECLVLFFKFAHFFYPNGSYGYLVRASAVLGIAIVQAFIIIMRLIVIRLFGSLRGSLLWLFLLGYAPVYCYSPIVYNDTPSMLVCASLIYCFLRITNPASTADGMRLEELFWIILFGVLCGIGHRLRIIVLIVPLAILVSTFLRSRDRWKLVKCGVIVIAVFLLTSFLAGKFAEQHYPTDEEMSEKYEIPLMHYVSMSFGDGYYNAEDVQEMNAIETLEQRRARGAERLIERINERGLLGTIEFMFVTKQGIMWGNCYLNSDYYISTLPRHPDAFVMRVLSKDGDLHRYIAPLFWAGHAFLLLGIALSFMHETRVDKNRLSMQLSIMGVFLFFTMWECNSRYLLCFIPPIVLCSFYGWDMMLDAALQKNGGLRKSIVER